MRVGTRSLLFGVHQFALHPWFVAAAWWHLYGFPWDPRLWVAFLVHDWGYWGRSDMDGEEGEYHPILGARLMAALFDRVPDLLRRRPQRLDYTFDRRTFFFGPWGEFALLHSRFFARMLGAPPSRLCYADKFAIVLTPWWVYLPLARLTGELDEYMTRGRDPHGKYANEGQTSESPREWHRQMQNFVRRWVESNV